jgi:hypothetical protein
LDHIAITRHERVKHALIVKMCCDRERTPGTELCKESSFCLHRTTCHRMINRPQNIAHNYIICAGFDRDASLTDHGHTQLDVEHLSDSVCQPENFECGDCHHNCAVDGNLL